MKKKKKKREKKKIPEKKKFVFYGSLFILEIGRLTSAKLFFRFIQP